MSKLDEMIKELCPDGVEYVPLGELEDKEILKLGRGNVISKNDINNNPGDYPIYSSSAVGDGEIGRYSKYMFDDERITWSIDGGGKLFYRNGIKYSVTNVGGWMKVLNESILNTKYLYYTLISQWQQKTFDYTHKAHPSVIRNEYEIPVPPLEIQEEIVKTLDKFTNYVTELTAELTARKLQYEYYRDKLLSENTVDEFKLEELVNIKNGRDYKHLDEGEIPVYGSGGIMTHVGDYCYNKPSVLIPRKGSLDKLYYVECPFWNVDTIFYTEINESLIIPKYLYYLLQKEHLEQYNKAGGVPSLTQSILNKLTFKIHSLEIQQEIVDVLDRFDIFCEDISTGLPAEIEARQKQYEYYRDKLLSFERKEA